MEGPGDGTKWQLGSDWESNPRCPRSGQRPSSASRGWKRGSFCTTDSLQTCNQYDARTHKTRPPFGMLLTPGYHTNPAAGAMLETQNACVSIRERRIAPITCSRISTGNLSRKGLHECERQSIVLGIGRPPSMRASGGLQLHLGVASRASRSSSSGVSGVEHPS